MQRAIGVKAAMLLLDRHMTVNGALEISLLELLEAVLDVLAQSRADIEILTRDLDLHGRRKYPCFALYPIHGRVCFTRQLAARSI